MHKEKELDPRRIKLFFFVDFSFWRSGPIHLTSLLKLDSRKLCEGLALVEYSSLHSRCFQSLHSCYSEMLMKAQATHLARVLGLHVELFATSKSRYTASRTNEFHA